jgi:hypothetical protein
MSDVIAVTAGGFVVPMIDVGARFVLAALGGTGRSTSWGPT